MYVKRMINQHEIGPGSANSQFVATARPDYPPQEGTVQLETPNWRCETWRDRLVVLSKRARLEL